MSFQESAKATFVGLTGSLVGLLLSGLLIWGECGGVVHAFRRHGVRDGIVALCFPPWAWYRGAEFFWHKDSDAVGSGLDPRYKRFMERALAHQARADSVRATESTSSQSDVLKSDASGHVNWRDGLLRVDDDTLLMYAAGMANLYAAMPIDLCALPLRGEKATEAQDERSQIEFRGMDSVVLEKYAAAQVAAVSAEDRGLPKVPWDTLTTKAAWRDIGKGVGDQQAHRLASTLDAPQSATDEDRCWAMRTLYFQILAIPPHEGAALLRGLMSVQ